MAVAVGAEDLLQSYHYSVGWQDEEETPLSSEIATAAQDQCVAEAENLALVVRIIVEQEA